MPETTSTTTTPAPDATPSMADLRKMVGNSEPEAEAAAPAAEPAKAEEPTTETPEAKQAEAEPAKNPESAEGTGDKQQEPAKEAEPEDEGALPPKVQKRIDKEIARTVSARKEAEEITRRAKEREQQQLSGKQGTEPVKPAPEAAKIPSDKPVRPVAPVQPVFGAKDQTWAEYEKDLADYKTAMAAHETALAEYETKRDEWLVKQAEANFESKQTAKQQQETHKSAWDSAVEKHGEEFGEAMDRLTARTPEPVQLAISQLENWPDLAMHLESSPEDLAKVIDLFSQNPYAAVAELGRIDARLQETSKPAPKPAAKAAPEQDLPEPPKQVGGGATAAAGVDFEKSSMKVFKREMAKVLSRDS